MAKQGKQFDTKLIDELLKGFNSPEEILGQSGLVKQLTKAILERALEGELTTHLGYDKHDVTGNNSGNSRNGHTNKTVKSEHGELPLNVPRDRNSTFLHQIIPKNQTRFEGFDDKILAMYARAHRREISRLNLRSFMALKYQPP
jgi:putative transposase